MEFFKKKNKIEDDYNKTFQKINTDLDKKAMERVIFKEVSSDKEILELVKSLKEHYPIIVNFSKMDYDGANKALSFISGATFVLNGEIIKLKEQVYLFTQKEEFLDGSLNQFISDL